MVACVDRDLEFLESAVYVGYLFHASLSDDPHINRQLARTHSEIEVLESARCV